MSEIFRAILIETFNVCNRKCWFCKFGQEREDAAVVQMDRKTIHKILENLKDLQYAGRISWYNVNEPLLDRRMVEIVKATREYCPRAFISFATNGDRLDEKVYGDLKANGLDALGVSIYDDRTFEKVARFADRQMVLIDMRKTGEGMLENRGGGIRQKIPEFERDRIRFQNRSCMRPFSMMVINPQGQVILCCADMYSDVVLGDVKTQRLEQIWMNERLVHYRETLNAKGRAGLQLCEECSYSGDGFRPFFPYFGNKPRPRFRDQLLLKLHLLRRGLES